MSAVGNAFFPLLFLSSKLLLCRRRAVTFCSMRARGHRGGFPNFNVLPCRAGCFLSPLSKVRHDTACSRSARHAPRRGTKCWGCFGLLMASCLLCDDTAERARAINEGKVRERVVRGAGTMSDKPFSSKAASLRSQTGQDAFFT